MLAPLVIFHELGHYLFAKLFGVKAEVFSVGFGPKIFSKQVGETDWRFSLFPLGGYVQLYGADPSQEIPLEERHRALQYQTPGKRFWIFFGGPLFNLILAVLVFMIILVIGESHIAPVIGRVEKGSYAEQVGFRSGDKITKIDQKEVYKFREDVFFKIYENPGKSFQFTVEREGEKTPIDLNVAIQSEDGFTLYGEEKSVGRIEGLNLFARGLMIGISDPQSKAALMGLKTGDDLVSIGGEELKSWEHLRSVYASFDSGALFTITYKERKGEIYSDEVKKIELTKPESSQSLAEDLGLFSSELFVQKTQEGSPAEKMGILPGDRLYKVEGKELRSFSSLKETIQKYGQKKDQVEVTWVRDGKEVTAVLSFMVNTQRDPNLNKKNEYLIGVMPYVSMAEPTYYIEQIWNPFLLTYRATEKVILFVYRNVVALGKMFTGDVSINTLGGPIMIGQLAGSTFERGVTPFLTLMAILSVGLGIINLMPIPVLDGGHLMLLSIEIIRRKPLTLRQMEVIQQVGLAFIILLMVTAMRNDLLRLPFFNE